MTVSKTARSAFTPGPEGDLTTISWEHEMVHDGEMYRASHLAAAVANDGTASIVTIVGTQANVHAVFDVATAVAAYVYLYEDSSTTAGTSLSAYNMDRASENAAYATLKHTPAITTAGTAIQVAYMNGGSGNASASRVGSIARAATEWILTAGQYVLRVTNKSGTAADIAVGITFYEVEA